MSDSGCLPMKLPPLPVCLSWLACGLLEPAEGVSTIALPLRPLGAGGSGRSRNALKLALMRGSSSLLWASRMSTSLVARSCRQAHCCQYK